MGPHIGVLCRTQFVRGKYDLLDRLQAYKVWPAPGDPRAGCPGGQVRDGDAESLGRSVFAGIAGTLAGWFALGRCTPAKRR